MSQSVLERTLPETLDMPIADVRRIVATALAEDLGAGDITTDNLVPSSAMARAAVSYRSGGIVCGTPVLMQVFRAIDESVDFDVLIPDGRRVEPGGTAAIVRGSARSI